MSRSIQRLFKKYIQGTDKGAVVKNVKVFVGSLAGEVVGVIACFPYRIYASSRVIKHTYDKRTAQEFDFFLENILLVIKYPDALYKNKSGKRGSFCFVKEFNQKKYLCVIEKAHVGLEVVTFFRIDPEYLKDYELLWEWKGDGDPSS